MSHTAAPRALRIRRRRRTPALLALLSLSAVAGLYDPSPELHNLRPVVELHPGRASLKETNGGAPLRWWARDVQIVIDGSVTSLGSSSVEAVERAFGTWLSASPHLPGLTFDVQKATRVPSLAADGQSRIYFAPIDVPGHEQDLAVTVAYSDTRTGEILEADIILNSRRKYEVLDLLAHSDKEDGDRDEDDHPKRRPHGDGDSKDREDEKHHCSLTYDIESVVAHEAGHFFGLGEDIEDRTTTMYARTSACDVEKRLLSPVDVDVINVLYAEPLTQDGTLESAPAAACAVTQRSRAGSEGFLWVALGALIGSARRRRP